MLLFHCTSYWFVCGIRTKMSLTALIIEFFCKIHSTGHIGTFGGPHLGPQSHVCHPWGKTMKCKWGQRSPVGYMLQPHGPNGFCSDPGSIPTSGSSLHVIPFHSMSL